MSLTTEQQRQVYLEAMGIQAYFPRRVLPGARVSPDYEIESRPATAGHLPEPEKPTADAVQVKTEHAQISQPKVYSRLRPPQIDENSESQLRFKLRYLSINQTLSVVDELPFLQSGNDNSRSLALLHSILRALQVTPATDAFQAEVFNWPLTENRTIQGSEIDQARQAVNGFIRRRFEMHGFKVLLVFTSQLDQVIVPQSLPAQPAQFTYPGLGFHVAVSKSLHAMLAVPTLKKSLWQDLQSARKLLAVESRNQS